MLDILGGFTPAAVAAPDCDNARTGNTAPSLNAGAVGTGTVPSFSCINSYPEVSKRGWYPVLSKTGGPPLSKIRVWGTPYPPYALT